MQNFLIGQYGCFDKAKLRQDFRPGFWGVEACLFPEQTEKSANSAGLSSGICAAQLYCCEVPRPTSESQAQRAFSA